MGGGAICGGLLAIAEKIWPLWRRRGPGEKSSWTHPPAFEKGSTYLFQIWDPAAALRYFKNSPPSMHFFFRWWEELLCSGAGRELVNSPHYATSPAIWAKFVKVPLFDDSKGMRLAWWCSRRFIFNAVLHLRSRGGIVERVWSLHRDNETKDIMISLTILILYWSFKIHFICNY